MKKLFLSALFISIASITTFSQGLWQSGTSNDVVYTLRKVGINTSLPQYNLDVAGSSHAFNSYTDSLSQALSMKAKTAQFDFMLALTANIDNLSVSLDATIKGKLFTNNIYAQDIIAKSIDAEKYLLKGNPFPVSPWKTEPDGSISFNGQVLVKRLDASEGISIGNFKFKNGGSVLPPAPIKDTISSSYEIVLRSDAELLQLAANQVRVQQQLGVGKIPGAGVALDIVGDVKSTGSIGCTSLSSSSVTTNNAYVNGNLRLSNLSGSGDRVLFIDPNGNLKTVPSTQAAGPFWETVGNSGVDPAVNFLGTTDAQDLVFKTDANGAGGERMRIMANGDVRFITGGGAGGGNVIVKTDVDNGNIEAKIGIGTENPVRALHIYTEHIVSLPPCPTCVDSHNGMRLEDLSGSGQPIRTIWDIMPVTGPVNGSLIFSKGDPNDDHAVDAKMMIAGNGNVGIGTSDPIQTLDVNGKINLSGGVIQKGGSFPIISTGDLGLYSLDMGNYMRFVTNNAPIRFFSNGGTNPTGTNSSGNDDEALISIEPNGNVGIGTTNPQSTLHLFGDDASTECPVGIRLQYQFNGPAINGCSISSTWDIKNSGSGTLDFSTPAISTPVMTMVNSGGTGNVGIGTTIPSAKLHIGGTAGIDGIRFPDGTLQTSAAVFQWTSAGNDIYYDPAGGGKVFIATDPSQIIGPSYELNVCGTIHAKEVIIEATIWCDFKLKPGYKRMTWQEKLAHIETFGYLPEMDSGLEIETKGLKLAKNLRGMIWNIEDNTMDIIDLKKENVSLKKELAELKKEVEQLKEKK